MSDNFARRFSLEATRPNAAEIAALAELLPPERRSISRRCRRSNRTELIAAAALLRRSGLEPVVHIAARRIRAAADLQNLLAACAARPMYAVFW